MLISRASDVLTLSNPPCCEDEWDDHDAVHEATPPLGTPPTTPPPSKRILAGSSAGREVRRTRVRTERAATADLLRRLEALKRRLRVILADGASGFRQAQIAQTIRAIDLEIDDATRDMAGMARGHMKATADLGLAHVDQTIVGAQFRPLVTAGITTELVSNAADMTADLLRDPMQQYRRKIVAQVRRLTTQGVDFGTEWTNLTKVLDKAGFDNAAFQAERILRTEMSRVFNASTYDRMTAQAASMPFLRKAWIRTGDVRVRESHIQAATRYHRGAAIAIGERFSVGKATMRFPVDPLAEPAGQIAASETIQCRCNLAMTFDPAGIRQTTAARVALAMRG